MKSLWQESIDIPRFPKLKGNARTDVLIIGGGITGILCAYFLHQKGIPYLLVEKNRICSATTGHTTAKITLQHGLIYDQIRKDYGLDRAKLYLQANRRAMEQYEKLCEGIDCDYEMRDNAVYSTDHRKKLEAEMKTLLELGCEASFCETTDLPMKIVGAICVPNQACFHPLKFLSSIVKDLHICENTFVRELDGKDVRTDEGRIHAEQVIVATHFPFINTHGGYFLKLYQHRSYVIALEGTKPLDRMYVDEVRTGLSFRNYGKLLLLGGGGHRTGKMGGNYEELRRFAGWHYPQATERFAWAAQDCMSLDGIPYIGRYSKGTPNVYVASGFNKWGMTGSMIAATCLCDEISGIQNDYSELFHPSRSMMKTQLFINGGEAVKNLLSFSGKRCPHMGCALKWNHAEHTWDCPCHGSRFSKEGEILDNPSNKRFYLR